MHTTYFASLLASSMLFMEYQQARLDAAAEEIVMSSQGNASSASNLFHNLSFKTERAQLFQYWFDRYCKHAFLNCMNSYNDYSQPLLHELSVPVEVHLPPTVEVSLNGSWYLFPRCRQPTGLQGTSDIHGSAQPATAC